MHKISNNDIGNEIIDWPVHLARAIALAQNVITTAPNPRVGCVLVNQGEIVGEGWHVFAGEDHAEVMALAKAGARAKAATAFVSLEPCAHKGRTGPCCEALIAAQVSGVVIASIDPNPQVAGKGIAALEAAGITVTQLVDFDASARAINPGYFKRRESGRAYVRCKMAMSMDGRTALTNGESKWITGAESRADVQLLRAASSAVITGVDTVLIDDPMLNVRQAELQLDEQQVAWNSLALSRQPLRVILDSKLRTPTTANILKAEGDVRIYTLMEREESREFSSNVSLAVIDNDAAETERVNLDSVLESLTSEFECNEILIEAGATLCTAFLEQELIDELIVYVAPKFLGADARSLLNFGGLKSMTESRDFEIVDLKKIGGDMRVTMVPASVTGA